MAKKKFDFAENNEPKTVDELFEAQFANKKPDDSSALPPDIPISLKDINAMVNAAAAEDEGMVPEEVREQVVDLEDEEGVYDLEELNEESLEDIEEELELEDELKAKRKRDKEKGRKNEKAYQEKTRQMDEANRLHAEEMRKQSERIRQQEEANKAASSYDETLTSTEKRNRALQEDDFEADKKAEAKAQREKTDNIIAEQRAKEEAAKNYQGFENKNIDFSGRNEHGTQSSNPYENKSDSVEPVIPHKEEPLKAPEHKETRYEEPAKTTSKEPIRQEPQRKESTHEDIRSNDYKPEVKHEDSYKQEIYRREDKSPASDIKDNYRDTEKGISVTPVNINREPENQGSRTYPETYESATRQRDKQYMDEDYAKADKAREEARREHNRNLHSGASTTKQDNPSTTSRNDYRFENEGSKRSEREKVVTPIPSKDNRQNYQEGQTSSSKHNDESYSRRDIGGRAEVSSKRTETTSFQKGDNYGKDYSKGTSESSSSFERKPGQRAADEVKPSHSESYRSHMNEPKSDIPTDKGQEVRPYNKDIIRQVSESRSQGTSYKVGSGKGLDGVKSSIQVDNDKIHVTKTGITSTVIGNGSHMEDTKESSFISGKTGYYKREPEENKTTFRIDNTPTSDSYKAGTKRTESYKKNTLNNTEQRSPYIKDFPRQDKKERNNSFKQPENKNPPIKDNTSYNQGDKTEKTTISSESTIHTLDKKNLKNVSEERTQNSLRRESSGTSEVFRGNKGDKPSNIPERTINVLDKQDIKRTSEERISNDNKSGIRSSGSQIKETPKSETKDNRYTSPLRNTEKNRASSKQEPFRGNAPIKGEQSSDKKDNKGVNSSNEHKYFDTSKNIGKDKGTDKTPLPDNKKSEPLKTQSSSVSKAAQAKADKQAFKREQRLERRAASAAYLAEIERTRGPRVVISDDVKINRGRPVNTKNGVLNRSDIADDKVKGITERTKSGSAYYGNFGKEQPQDSKKANMFTMFPSGGSNGKCPICHQTPCICDKKKTPMTVFSDKRASMKQGIVINADGKIVSLATVRWQYGIKIGRSAVRSGENFNKVIARQIINAFKENDGVDAAMKVKVGVSGAFAVGAFLRTQRHNLGAGSNFLKAKGNSLANAGRFFKGAEGKELNLVPHTVRQFDSLLKKDKDLVGLSDKILKQQRNALLKGKKAVGLTDQQVKLLGRIENHLKLRERKLKLSKDKIKAGRFKMALSMLSSAILSSGDVGAQSISMALTTSRYFKGAYKAARVSGKLAYRATGFTFRTTARVGKYVNRKVPIVNKTTGKIVSSKPVQYINGRVVRVKEIKGQVVKELNGGLYNRISKAGTNAFNKAPDGLKRQVNKLGKGVNKVKDTTGKFRKGVNTVKNKAKKVTSTIAKPFKFITKPFKAIGAGFNWLKTKILWIGGILMLVYAVLFLIIMIGGTVTSMVFTDTDNLQEYVNSLNVKKVTWMNEIATAQSKGGQKHGKYNNVTVNYVDENGNTLNEIGNMKEILSMVAVHIENDWPTWIQWIKAEKVDTLAKQLWDDSHRIDYTEIGPYSCEGCEERDYKCTDPLPSDASAGRINLYNNFAARGGCIEYHLDIIYNCAENSTWVEGTKYNNANQQKWTNDDIRAWYNQYYGTGGCKHVHATTSPNKPAAGCSNYITKTGVTGTLEGEAYWPSTVYFQWNESYGWYRYDDGKTVYNFKPGAYLGDQIPFVKEDGIYKYYGQIYYCQDNTCSGHNTTITLYKCNGHHEIYCPADHYDLIVNAVVIHLPKLYEVDSNALGVVEVYPEDAAEDAFYWDKGNREWCENILNQDWESTYEGLVGLESSTVAGETLTDEELIARLEKIKTQYPDLSEDRLKVIETALGAVGRIPYYWGGYATGPGYEMNNFGSIVTPDSNGRNLKGLDCSHFVDWVCWTAVNNNLGNGWTGTIWGKTTAVNILSLKPGDLGFQNEGNNPVNHVGIYLGDGLWVHCAAGSNNNVVVNNTQVFTQYRRLEIFSD